MIKRITCLIMIIIIAMVSFCACGKKEDVNIFVPISSDPLCLDPQIADTDSAKMIINNCFEGLVRLNNENKVIPGVAKSWDISSDNLTYTFHLRTDSNWQLLKSFSDVLEDEDYMKNFKTTVTAKDFQFALRRAVNPITQADDAERLFSIKNAEKINNGNADISSLGVKAVDDTTLVVTLSRANPDFLRILTLPICMPCNEEFFNQTHSKYGLALKYTFCNGPFYLAKWVDDNSLSILRNEGYHGESKVEPSGVYFYINNDEESVVKKLKQHAYDFSFLTESERALLKNNKKLVQITSATKVAGISFNCADSFLKNTNARRALVMMTKFNEIGKSENATGLATGFVPDCVRFGNEQYRSVAGSISEPEYNEKQAVSLWKNALNSADLDSSKITIKCTNDTAIQMKRAIQNWQKLLGTMIVAKVEVVSEDDLNTAVSNGDYQIAVAPITAKSSNVTDTLKFFTTGDDGNISNYSSTAYDSLVSSIISSASGNEIIDKCRQAEKLIETDAVFCPLFTYSEIAVVGKDVTNIYVSPSFEAASFFLGGKK